MTLQLDDAKGCLLRIYERRRQLGGFDTNAEDFITICEVLLIFANELSELGKHRAAPPKRGRNAKARKTRR